jgi:mRNA interferase MazF
VKEPAAIEPQRGEIWVANFEATVGHEQAGRRPALILSSDNFNRSAAGLVFGLPLTTRDRKLYFHVQLQKGEGGTSETSFILCDQGRTLSKERLLQRLGAVSPQILKAVADRLRLFLVL